jgi:uncharacterized lipoprotein YbaY
MPTVTITVDWPDEVPAGATAYVRVEDVSRVDSAAPVVAEEALTDLSPPPQQVALAVGDVEPRDDYSVRVHVSLNGSRDVDAGDYVTTQAYPVLTRGATDQTRVRLQRVG